MKKMRVFILALVCLLALAGCSCKHEWSEADCVNPATCIKCGATEGEALGHTWLDATCTTARTCSVCGRTEGDPLGHTWVEATCTEPKTCSTCGEVVGDALGHTWTEATTEAPATCTVCGATEGEKIATDPRFVTAEAERFFGTWESTLYATGADLGVEDFDGTLEGVWVTTFSNAGEMVTEFQMQNEKEFREAMVQYTLAQAYKAFDEEGLDEEEANAAAKILTATDVEGYIRYVQDQMQVGDLVDQLMAGTDYSAERNGKFVYYVQGDELYLGTDWESELYPVSYEFIGSTLILADVVEYKAVGAAETAAAETVPETTAETVPETTADAA